MDNSLPNNDFGDFVTIIVCCDTDAAAPDCGHYSYINIEAQLSLGQPTILVVSDLQGHPRSVISISFDRV